MNSRGQALMEFVIILPIILLILLYIIDFTKVGINKLELESEMSLIIDLYENKKDDDLNNYLNQKNITINYNTKNNLTTITISKPSKYNMPLLKNILGSKIETKRTIYNEQ